MQDPSVEQARVVVLDSVQASDVRGRRKVQAGRWVVWVVDVYEWHGAGIRDQRIKLAVHDLLSDADSVTQGLK